MAVMTQRMKPMEERVLIQIVYGILEGEKDEIPGQEGVRPDKYAYTLLEIIHALRMGEYIHPIPGLMMTKDTLRLINREVEAGRIAVDQYEGRKNRHYRSLRVVR